jgi:hypothetical protein
MVSTLADPINKWPPRGWNLRGPGNRRLVLMQGQSSPAEDDARVEGAILGLLTDHEAQRPWSEDEVAREIGDPLDTTDAIRRLYAAGLVHRLDGFVFATRAATRSAEIAI